MTQSSQNVEPSLFGLRQHIWKSELKILFSCWHRKLSNVDPHCRKPDGAVNNLMNHPNMNNNSIKIIWFTSTPTQESFSVQLTPPHPSARAKSFPVPSGSTPTAGGGDTPIWSRTDRTHPTVPSPPHARTRRFGTLRNSSKLWMWNKNLGFDLCAFTLEWTYPSFGPPCVKSKTWRGFRSHWNFWSNFAPWFPPLFGLMKTRTGVRLGVGIGFITNVFSSFSLDFFLPAGFFFGVFLNEDLKLPFRGSLTIHDGGTIIREWTPVGARFIERAGGGRRRR